MVRPIYASQQNNRGFAVLISVLIVGAFGIAIAMYLVLSGFYSYQDSFVLEQSKQAASLADACVESALNHIQLCSSTLGMGSVQMGSEACNYEIISTGEQSRIIQSTAQVGPEYRKVKVSVNQIDPIVTVDLWQEVPAF